MTSFVAGAIFAACAVFWASGQETGKEIRISEQYPPAELRFQAQRFVAVHRKPVPKPGSDDQWVVVRDRNWAEQFRAYPGQDLAKSVRFKLFEIEQRKVEPVLPTEAGGESLTGFGVANAALSDSGMLAISGSAWLQSGRSIPVIVFYGLADGRLVRIANTSPVKCWSMEFDADGDLWCIGSDIEELRQRQYSYGVLYRYSADGKLLLSGIESSTLPGGRAPEADAIKGGNRIFFARSGKPLLVIPAVDTIILAGRDAKEIRRWQPATFGKGVTYSLAEDGRKTLLALLPEQNGMEHQARYKLRELVAESGGSAGRKILEEADDATAVRWVLRGGAGGRDFAGRSTELVGLDGRYPVMWDRSAGLVEWLEPVD